MSYNPANWFWIVGEDATQRYSSAKAMFIPTNDSSFVAFTQAGNSPSRIGSMEELVDIFRQHFPGGHLGTYLAAKRFEKETGGVTLSGVTIDTSRESQSMIGNAYAYLQASGAASVQFKAASGWVTLSAEQITDIALAVGAHVQAMFAREATVQAGIDAGTITTREQIDAAFA